MGEPRGDGIAWPLRRENDAVVDASGQWWTLTQFVDLMNEQNKVLRKEPSVEEVLDRIMADVDVPRSTPAEDKAREWWRSNVLTVLRALGRDEG